VKTGKQQEQSMQTETLTMSQALVRFLAVQYSARDGHEQRFFGGCFGIFGHGNISGMGQALQQYPTALRYYQSRNEQAMVNSAAAFAKHSNRLRTLACTSSIGPGATNMVTGAALATINRLPVLLLPGDIFARRNVAPVLQQLESEHSQDISVNDCFKPVSRYWDRINRPDQLITALPEVMRVLTSPVDTGAVTLCLPQDVQTEAFAYPAELFEKRVWRIPRNRPDVTALGDAVALIRRSAAPMIVAGGGVRYSEATGALKAFVDATGIPVSETMAGKGSLRYDHPLCLGAIGVTGTPGANEIAAQADLVIGIGTRYSDFTTSSKTLFANPNVRFININVAEFDTAKHSALGLIGDARAVLEALSAALQGWSVDADYRARASSLHGFWEREVDAVYALRHGPLPSQGELIGAINDLGDPDAVMINAAGSLPGDLHKLWRARHPSQYHLDYGYSTMGYEIAGGLGIKMAEPSREVYVLVGDGSWLMLSQEVITSIQEGFKLTVILMDNRGYKSIGGLSRSLGQGGFGTRYTFPENDQVTTDLAQDPRDLPVDLAMNAESMGAHVIRAEGYDSFVKALRDAKDVPYTTVIYVQNDRYQGVPGYSWWDVPPAEVSTMSSVQEQRAAWAAKRTAERTHL
jgi:3D-(3,5/4)-trihydroxycyclohexane-1,2-dione acylhydrolase (decyclizing)